AISWPTTRRKPAWASGRPWAVGVWERGLALAFVMCVLTAAAAAGHAVLQRSEPRAASTLKRAPDEVRLYFSERLEPAYSTVRAGRRDTRVDRTNPLLLRATLPPLPTGTYKVQWRVLSVDGDVTEGVFTFSIE